MEIRPTKFTGFYGVSKRPRLKEPGFHDPRLPIANNVKAKEFIKEQWEQKRTPLRAPGL